MNKTINTDDLVGAVGIKSNILAETFKTTTTIGHTLQLDLDGLSEAPDREWIEENLKLSDVYLVFQTSENNYAIHGLRNRDFDSLIRTLAGIKKEDPRHFKNFVRRNGSVLRMSRKGGKPRPQLIDVIRVEPKSFTEVPEYSRPHIDFYCKVYPEWDIYGVMPTVKAVGDKIKTEKYLTKEVKE